MQSVKSSCLLAMLFGSCILTARISVPENTIFEVKELPTETPITFETLVKNSNAFEENIKSFPVRPNSILEIVKRKNRFERSKCKKHIAEQANGVRILIDKRAYELFEKYLDLKKKSGNKNEKAVYNGMTINQFIDRLLQKRPLTFFGRQDVILERKKNAKILQNVIYSLVGTLNETYPFVLENYLCYEEVALAALISVSVPTFFINDCNRSNAGEVSKKKFIKEGIFIAGVGPRFEVDDVMETQYMVLSQKHDCPTDGTAVSELWRKLYEIPEKSYCYSEMRKYNNDHELRKRFSNDKGSKFFLDITAYKTRLSLTLNPIILQAQREGEARKKQVVLRLVGFGLGNWAKDPKAQEKLFIGLVKDILLENSLPNIDIVEFLYISSPGEIKETLSNVHGQKFTLRYTKNQPASTEGVPKGHLVVATYAWDGNSFPGNEYWINYLNNSGDPAAACCSTIQELQNPFINTALRADRCLCIS